MLFMYGALLHGSVNMVLCWVALWPPLLDAALARLGLRQAAAAVAAPALLALGLALVLAGALPGGVLVWHGWRRVCQGETGFAAKGEHRHVCAF